MTQFETELIRAIEHGCPECNYKGPLTVYSLYSASSLVDKGIGWGPDWSYPEFIEPFTPEQIRDVICPRCDVTLWDDTNGWIPELQEIVKGE